MFLKQKIYVLKLRVQPWVVSGHWAPKSQIGSPPAIFVHDTMILYAQHFLPVTYEILY